MASIWAQAKQQSDATNPPPVATPDVWAQIDPQQAATMAALKPVAEPAAPSPWAAVQQPQPQVALAPQPLTVGQKIQNHLHDALEKDYIKDANPYGSENNHPGFLGKVLHGLNVATGGVNRRGWEENDLVKQINAQNTADSENAYRGAETEHTQAETKELPANAESTRAQQGATTRHLNDESDDLENPRPTYSVHDTEAGPLFVNNQTGTAQHLTVDGVPVGPKMQLKESQPIMGDDGKPHTYMLDDKGNKVVDLGVHYERPITVSTRTADKEKSSILKEYQPSLDSAERFNVMTKNYEDAIKHHDQQAMLSLLANHLGMTMGLQKGSRLTRDIIHEAQQSRPWLQGLKAQFDKDGYLSGVTLTPEQMRQMVDLGRGRFSEDTVKARNTSRYLGATDDGPERTPSKVTINYYLGLANGDAAKAKELAAQDGWTVK